MGLGLNGIHFLVGESKRGLRLGRTLTLGHQRICTSERQYSGFLERLGVSQKERTYADDFFLGLGAAPLEVMDASAYEGAQLIHDLNDPVRQDLKSTYDTVIDIGTLEHVFNYPVAIRTCMELVKPGGNLILITPWNNLPGHGLYQFSPELFYSVLSAQNGYQIERMMIVADGHWYAIRNPSEIKSRIEIRSNDVIELFIRAKRVSEQPMFTTWPQQSDYSDAWVRGSYAESEKIAPPSFKGRIANRIPVLHKLRSTWRDYQFRRSLMPARNPGMIQVCKSDEIPS